MSVNTSESNRPSTKLANESTFTEQTKDLLEFSDRTHAKAVMLYILFEHTQGTLSNERSDLIIKTIAERLVMTARDSDIYAHLGGMAFVNLSIKTSERHTDTLIEKLSNEFAQTLDLSDDSSIKLNVKLGAAEFPAQGSSYEPLMGAAKQTALQS